MSSIMRFLPPAPPQHKAKLSRQQLDQVLRGTKSYGSRILGVRFPWWATDSQVGVIGRGAARRQRLL